MKLDTSTLGRVIEARAGFLLALCLMISLLLSGVIAGTFGAVGPDGDDQMRLVQVRDLLSGQGWFDLRQERLGPEGGTQMHWSRLVDLPIIIVTFLLTPFIGQANALSMAIAIVPVLYVVLVVAGVILGARALAESQSDSVRKGLTLFACVITFALFFQHFRFLPGAIDHHNLQLGLLALVCGLLLDARRPALRMGLAGSVLAFAVAVGSEIYGFVAVIALFVALDWMWTGKPARAGAMAFGAGFAAILAVCFVATVPPSDYAQVWCDQLSSVTVLAGGMGGLGLLLAAHFLSEKPVPLRLVALVGIGLVCASAALLYAPQCLSNPLNELSQDTHAMWLNRVDEARPVLAMLDGQANEVAYRLGMILIGIVACVILAVTRPEWRRAAILLGVLGIVSLGFTLYQTRFYVFGHVFALLPLAALIALVREGCFSRIPQIAYLPLLAVSLPAFWGIMVGLLGASSVDRPSYAAVSSACDSKGMIEAMAALPSGRILGPASESPDLLLGTGHSVLYGHYHRNADGIAAALTSFTSPSEVARRVLSEAGVDYVLFCPEDPDMSYFAAQAPEGFIASLSSGNVPGWLEPVGRAGESIIYRINRD